MYCRQCGYNNDQYSKLCHRCGSVLRDAEEHYNAPQPKPAEAEQGVLKYARKGDDFITLIKAPFRRLEREAEKHRRRWAPIVITTAVIAICLVVWLIVLSANSCHEEEELVYGAVPANAAHGGLAASDGEFIYYSCPFGENPGLYRLAVSSGEVLKISFHCLRSLSAADGWVYGIDPDGTVIRVSSDGLTSEQVLSESNVKCPVVVGEYIYYIGSECRLYRADLGALSRRRLARSEPLTEKKVSEYIIYEDSIYYIEMTDADYERLFTVISTVTPPPITDANGKEVEQEPYTVSELVAPEGKDIPENPGCIWTMGLDGEGERELLATPVMRLTAGSGFIYFQTDTVLVISATDIDPNAPADMTYDLPVKKSWRLNLENLRYSTLLEPGVADSALVPTDDGFIYYISPDDNLERTDLSGDGRSNVLTYEQNSDSIAVCGDYIFVMCDEGTRMISMRTDGSERTLLCEYLPGVELPQSAGDEAPSDEGES